MISRFLTCSLPFCVLLLTACDYTPKGTMLFRIEGHSKEFDRAFIEPVPEEGVLRKPPERLRWVDTNAWLTSSTLSPGKYRFSARSDQGGYYGRDIDITDEQVRYVLPAETVPLATPLPALTVSGTISHSDPQVLNGNVAVLFIGQSATLRQVKAHQGRWSVSAPGRGTWHIRVHTLGDKPLSHATGPVEISENIDLGTLSVR